MAEAITAEGLENLKAELAELEGPARREIAATILAARELGDLSENAEYHAAKEVQAHLETKILRLVERLRNAQVVDADENAEHVTFGATVDVEDVASGRTTTYTIVGRPRPTSRPASCLRSPPWHGPCWVPLRATPSPSRRPPAHATCASPSCTSALNSRRARPTNRTCACFHDPCRPKSSLR